jgi:hypothetical protein
MSFYGATPWWDTRYKIRRGLTLTPDSLNPGSESACAVKLLRQPLIGKIKGDYSDLSIIHHVDGATPTVAVIPFYVIEEDAEYLSVIFDAVEPITGTVNSSYFLYYCAKVESRLNDAVDILDKDILSLIDSGQNESETKWTFQKPTVYWIGNATTQSDAKAVFEFIGHKADFFFKVGPSYGKFEYQIGDSEKTLVDCFNSQASDAKLVTIDTNKLGTNKVRFIVLGQKNPASSSSLVELVRVEYHQILLGDPADEEFYSDISNTFTIGS